MRIETNYNLMTSILLVILLVLCGVLLLLAELFLLPGFGIAGVSGFISLIASVIVAYIKLTPLYPYAGHITLAATIIVSALAIWAFVKSRAIEKMALDTTIDSSMPLAEGGNHIDRLREEAENHKS